MHRIIRQMILGFGTFGTGTALLYLDVNPYLLILTDTVVGIGMLFAAGSLTVSDLHLKRKGVAGDGPVTDTGGLPTDGTQGTPGFRASLGKLGGSLKPAIGQLSKGEEEKKARTKEIDQMLDTALVGPSKRLISIAEGKETAPGPAEPAIETTQHEDLLREFSRAGEVPPFLDDEGTEEETSIPPVAPRKEGSIGAEIPAASLDVLSLADRSLGADDLLSALRLEVLKEKKRDDTSLLRDLKGVKVTGKQLLNELNSLVKDLRGR